MLERFHCKPTAKSPEISQSTPGETVAWASLGETVVNGGLGLALLGDMVANGGLSELVTERERDVGDGETNALKERERDRDRDLRENFLI